MQTLKLWLEDDPDMPPFKKLAYEVVDVDIQEVLERGTHPWSYHQANRNLRDRFIQLLNADEAKIKELVESKYCENFDATHVHYPYGERDSFEDFLHRINDSLRFVNSLTYRELLEIASEQLRRRWNHATAKQLAQGVCYNFNDLRALLKTKSRHVKLSSYGDVDGYDLAKILSLEDFQSEDRLLIRDGLAINNFRLATFLKSVTDENGLLRLTSSINDFQLVSTAEGSSSYRSLSYRCHHQNGIVRLIPGLREDPAQRAHAKRIAERWRTDNGTYCFTTSMTKLREMVTAGDFEAVFPALDYQHKPDVASPVAHVQRREIQRFTIGRYLTEHDCGDQIKAALREHDVSMTGTKEQLADKLAHLCVKLYRRHEPEMRQFFRTYRFIHIENGNRYQCAELPILRDVNERNMLLAMFVTRHLRGNTILESAHENDAYELIDLARSLVKREIAISGAFLRIED